MTAPAEPKPKAAKVRKPKRDVPGVTRPMTYEEYLASPEEMARYDILDGWKVYRLYGDKHLPNPTVEHQDIALNTAESFRAYQRAGSGRGRVILAPCDVLITRRPLRKRQPDVLFISPERFGDRRRNDPAPLSPAPELVVEIVSPSDKPSVLAAKLADYRSVDVREVWVVRAEAQSVEVVRLTLEEIATAATYERGQSVVSLTFPDLLVPVDDIFAE